MSHSHGIAPFGRQYVTHPPEVVARMERLCQFHERTKQPPADEISRPDQRPAIFRVFADAPKIPLPTKLLDAPTGVLKVLSMGMSALPESMAHPPQNLQTLASWLHMAAGITGKVVVNESVYHLRSCPSAGALYPSEIYVLAMGLSDLAPGLYHFSAKDFSLRKLRDGWESLSQLKRGRPDLEVLKTMPALLLVSSIFWRSAWKYGNRAYRYATLDAGHLMENLVQSASSLGIQTMVRMHLNDRNTRELLGVSKEGSFDTFEAVQGMVAWGDTAANPIDAPKIRSAPPRLEPIARAALSASCTDYPELRTAHDDCVAPGVGIHELRPPHTERCAVTAESERVSLGGDEVSHDLSTLQAMKLRRSVRAFNDNGISRDQFSMLNRVAFRGGTYHPILPDGQHLGLVRAFWFVHQITGVTPGVWYYHASHDQFTPMRYGDLRFDAKYLCDDQEFCGTASAVCVMVSDLKEAMMRSSPDSYRLAHLEAGLAAQRMYLACTAMSIDSCAAGSFRDDELRKALDLHRGDWQCLYAFAVGGVRRAKQAQVAIAPEPGRGGVQFKE